ncbi:MAG: nitroreductase family protein, partial [Spirochaetales bacterium]|nr:nitroreductase family protein [Candidatus Physcosoma equi]
RFRMGRFQGKWFPVLPHGALKQETMPKIEVKTMDVKEALLKRRSVRKFTEEPVSKEHIEALMHAAMSGPSACNATPWELYVISNPEKLEALRSAAHYSKIVSPLAVVVVGNLDEALPRFLAPYWVQDCSAATENILLEAVELGLGSVWCGIHPQERAEKKVSEILGLKETEVPLNIIYIGHPAEFPEARDQYLEERVHIID